MKDTTRLESMPPLRNAPRGTSLMRRRLTAHRRRSPSASTASRSVKVTLRPYDSFQYRANDRRPSSMSKV
jgi:hypothetical protein